ncbi:MAG TPA: hypothetical protein VGG75_09035 [Trebonia sp.]|jgi:hypothetical protein
MYENQIRGDGRVYIADSGAFDAITTAVAMLVTATRPYESESGGSTRDGTRCGSGGCWGGEAVGWAVLAALARTHQQDVLYQRLAART